MGDHGLGDEELLNICLAVIDSALDELPMPDDVADIASAVIDELIRRGIASPFH